MDPIKAYEHDGISIHMLTSCDPWITKPLFLLLKYSLEKDGFFKGVEKENIVFQKSGYKQLIKNARLVSLLPIRGKIFETMIFNSLFK